MLEADVTGTDRDASPDVVNHSAASTAGSDCASGRATSPPPLTAFLVDHADSAKPSAEEDAVLRGWDWPTTATHNNNNYSPIKPEVGLESPQSGSRMADVATALAGVHGVLHRIDSIAEKQQVVGDVIVQLQVLRCRLQLAQVNQSPSASSSSNNELRINQ